MIERGILPFTAEEFGLGFVPQDEDSPGRGRLSIPYLTPAGPWHIKYRCIQQHSCKEAGHPKYIYDSGQDQHLFNAMALRTADEVCVVEGEIDAITIEQAGMPAVAYPGADTWGKNKHWRWCFDAAQLVTVIADGDEPGTKAANVVRDSLRTIGSQEIRVVQMPPGEDANSFILAHGVDEFLEKVSNA